MEARIEIEPVGYSRTLHAYDETPEFLRIDLPDGQTIRLPIEDLRNAILGPDKESR